MAAVNYARVFGEKIVYGFGFGFGMGTAFKLLDVKNERTENALTISSPTPPTPRPPPTLDIETTVALDDILRHSPPKF
jgi:hypothetical protein